MAWVPSSRYKFGKGWKLSRHYIVIYLPIAFIFPVHFIPYQTQFIFTTELLITIFINLNFKEVRYFALGGKILHLRSKDEKAKSIIDASPVTKTPTPTENI